MEMIRGCQLKTKALSERITLNNLKYSVHCLPKNLHGLHHSGLDRRLQRQS